MKIRKTISILLSLLFIITAVIPAFSFNAEEANTEDFSSKIQIDLGKAESAGYFTEHNNIVCAFNESEGSMMLATTGGIDPRVCLNVGGVSADIYKYVAITYRMPKSNSLSSGRTQFFFMANGNVASIDNMMTFSFERSYTYKTEIIDLSDKAFWQGDVRGIRIDPFEIGNASAWDTMYINSVSFYKDIEEAKADVETLNKKADGIVADIEGFEEKASDTGYNVEVYTEPLWEGNVTYHESVFPLLNPNGTMSPINLVYDIDKIVSVRNSYHNIEYKYGRDYTVSNGKLVIKTKAQGGQINNIPYIDVYSDRPLNSHYYYSSVLGIYLFCQDFMYQRSQLMITYTHTSPYKLYVPQSKTETLQRAVEKLKSKKPMNIVFCGDSVTHGHNSSWLMNCPPYAPRWSQMSVDALAEIYDNPNLTHINTAVGGTMSDWGYATIYDNVIRYAPDLCILAWGGNDGATGVSAQTYYQNMKASVDAVRASCPDCDIIIVASLIMNPELQGDKNPYFVQYLDALWDIAMQNDHVAVVDFTSFHRSLHTVKRHVDITENNINHINDFTSRMYAQSIVAALTGEQNDDIGTPSVFVSGDRIYASNGKTMLTPNGGNDTSDTYIGTVTDSSVYAYGWAACSARIKSFGYRSGGKVVVGSAKMPTEFAVTNAGDAIAGYNGSATRFYINIPIDTESNEVYAVAELIDGQIVDLWKITYDTPEKPKPVEFKYKVSADQIWASDGKTDLAKRGNNDTSGTEIDVSNTDSIIAFGWLASTVKITKFGYRYGNNKVFDSPLYQTEKPVLDAGAPIAGKTGSTSRFRITIPIDKTIGEVWAIAQLEDGKTVDLWKITYDAEDPDDPDEPIEVSILAKSFNTVILDNNVLCDTADAMKWLSENPLELQKGYFKSLTLRGWSYLDEPVSGFVYRIDSMALVKGNFIETRNDVKAVINKDAEGYRIPVKIDNLKKGTHKITLYAVSKSGVEKEIESFTISITDKQQDFKIISRSVDSVTLDNKLLCNNAIAEEWVRDNPIVFEKGDFSTVTVTGWSYLNTAITFYGYRIDGGELVFSSKFFAWRPDVKRIISNNAESYSITTDISDLNSGAHTLEIFAIPYFEKEVKVCSIPFEIR